MKRDFDSCMQWKRRLDRVAGLATALAALLVYALTLSRGVFPGQSAALMATYAGLEPLIAPAHPIWGTLVGWLAGTPINAMRLNAFSTLCGVVSVWLFYHLVSRLVFLVTDPGEEDARDASIASVLAGSAAALALAFSVPFWMVSTRLHYQGFDLMLLLLLTHLFIYFCTSGATWAGMIFALLYGACVVESIIFIPVLPVFVFYVFYSQYIAGRLRLGKLSLMGLSGSAGLCFYLLVAYQFSRMGDLTLRGYSGFANILRTMLVDQSHLARRSMQVLGGYLVVVPWLAMLLAARRSLRAGHEWGLYLFHLVVTIIAILILGNAPVSPWGVLREAGGLPVTMYAMTAMVAGYLVAYWYLRVAHNRSLKRRATVAGQAPGGVVPVVGAWLGYGLAACLLVTVVVAAVINGFEASGRRGAFADICAREMLDHLKGRPWLVSDGMFDSHLQIEAARRGQPLKLLALHKNDNPIYIRQVKKLIDQETEFAAADKVRLKNVLDLGIMAFIQDWMAEKPGLSERLAVMSAPDLIVGAGWTVAPCYFGFVGVTDRESLRGVDFIGEYAPFWERMARMLAKSRGTRDPVAAYRGTVRRQVGFVANNTGVLLEELGRPEDAYRVYKHVRAIDSDNISALLNMAEMLGRDPAFHPEDKELVETDLRNFVENLGGKQLPVWSLSRFFGYVRSPVLFAQLGWTWALSGQPGMAMAGLERAAAMSQTPASRLRVRGDMAEIFIQQGDEERGEAIYEEILKSEPDNQRALVSMARIEMRRGAIDKARTWLERAGAAGVDNSALTMERAAIDLAANNYEQARVKLTELAELQPKNLQVQGMLAISMMQMKEFDEVERRVIPRMEAIAGTPDNYLVQITRGQLAYQRGEKHYVEARNAFERASVLRPGLPMLMEWILRLDFVMDDKAAAEQHARQLLRINRNHGFANYIMGSLMMRRGRKAEAEDYLRRSVSESKSAAALNDLAELLRQSGDYEEAERQVRAAIQLAPDLYFAWDTLGGVLTDTKRLDDAEIAYVKALEIFQDDLRVHLNLAKLLLRKNDRVRAREIVSKIQPRRSELPAAEQEELSRLIRELTPGAK